MQVKAGAAPPLPVTVVVPVKNEAPNLARCLACLSGFQKVVVIDSGSTDQTARIAEGMGAEVIQFQWDGKYPKKRNWYLKNHIIDTPWVLFIDADEYVTEAFKKELTEVLPDTDAVGFWLAYRNHFLGRALAHGDVFSKLALFRAGYGYYEEIAEDYWSSLDMEVHEHPVLHGAVGKLHAPIEHEDFKGIKAYIARHNEYSSWEAQRYMAMTCGGDTAWHYLNYRQKVKYRLLASWLFAPLYFVYSYVFRMGFLDGKPGFIFALGKLMYFWQVKIKIDEFTLCKKKI